MRLSVFFFVVVFLTGGRLLAQTQHQSTGWLFLLNNTKISKKWGTYLDMQLRSADKWDNVRNFLFRPGITYYANGKNELTLGYLLNQTYTHTDGPLDRVLSEHRIWEQYVYKHKAARTVIAAHRFRLEHRFIERAGKEELFAQRFRYFARFIIPLEKGVQSFEKGAFVALQNELFFNIQHKDELNHKFFDQNRAYAAAGYRFSKKLDIEAGYLNQAVKGLNNNTVNNVVQLAVYTKF
ncbi:Protein of unknown function [Pedobacter westerhofensis]|uniref:DUF2490 domain-containing protein n=1 Tax=Pedobacter westerhofensis TaxID=425512 RepID=A0A521AHR6_9SPHI|nr:DUF2490 domain-containing protein [Pedobacter westerhofensis]SMO34323.1 Protein of unknown function [Pedobacter westerhofensis]